MFGIVPPFDYDDDDADNDDDNDDQDNNQQLPLTGNIENNHYNGDDDDTGDDDDQYENEFHLQNAAPPPPTTKDEKNILVSCYQEHCAYLPPMLGWFFFSAILSSFNKFVFGSTHMAFPCPLLLTSLHFLGQWAFSYWMCEEFPDYFGLDRICQPQMGWKQFLLISTSCGLVAAGDIGLSNLSLVHISITFYTMVKSSAPIFVLLWAYIFNIEPITPALILCVAIIAAGEFLTVVGEVEFVLQGFVLCLIASMLSGARWTLIQLQLQSLDPLLKTTIVTMRLLSPVMFLSMVFLSITIEQPWKTLYSCTMIEAFFNVLVLGLIGSCLAICMIMCELYLIMHTSAFVLMIGGVLKEMLTIFVGVTVFHDQLNVTNSIGCMIVLLGVLSYKFTKKSSKSNDHGNNHNNSNEKKKTQQKKTHTFSDKNGTLPRTTTTTAVSKEYESTSFTITDDDDDEKDQNDTNTTQQQRQQQSYIDDIEEDFVVLVNDKNNSTTRNGDDDNEIEWHTIT